MHLKSHINGRNATVTIYPDRVEWRRKSIMTTGAKAALGVATAGMSLLATGVRGTDEGEIIPIDQISHVSRKKGMGLNTVIVLTTSAGDLAMRVSHADADHVIELVSAIKRGDYQAAPVQSPAAPQVPATAPMAPAPAAPAEPSVMDQIAQLGQLHDAGILADAEFAAKKADLLAKF